ncbi:uncharacterized protein LOC144356158 [Saccoglossus kowalevskii]
MGSGATKQGVPASDVSENTVITACNLLPVIPDSPETIARKTLLTEKVNYLRGLESYSNNETCDAIICIDKMYSEAKIDDDRKPLGDHLAELGFGKLFVSMRTDLMQEDLFEQNSQDISLKVYTRLKKTIHNYSDVSQLLCSELGRSGAVAALLSELKKEQLSYKRIDMDDDGKLRRWIKSTLGTLHNTIRMCVDNVPIFRQSDAVPLLMEYLKCTYLIVRAKALLNLVYIVDEDENDKIMTGGTNIAFLVKMLQSALQSPSHMSKTYYFDAEELVDGINKLATNDQNKKTLVECNVLPLLVQMMKEGQSEEEIRQAARCIWTLAFHEDNKDTIRNEADLMDELRKQMHCSNKSSCGGACRTARGALWVLGEEESVRKKEHSDRAGDVVLQSQARSTGHVMISYQWDAQKTMVKVKNKLKDAGYKVWMDIEQMEGSTLEAMASAVENAAVVLICFSQKYKDSPSCRTEAEYTYRLNKPFIPLKIQSDYQPDGWLGILLGTKLYFDFSAATRPEKEMPKLLRELGNRGMSSQTMIENPVPNTVAPVVGAMPPRNDIGSETTTWTNSDVMTWLEGIGLQHLKNRFREYNGEMILGLRLVGSESPDFFYSSLKSDLGFKKLIDIIKFRNALDKLR